MQLQQHSFYCLVLLLLGPPGGFQCSRTGTAYPHTDRLPFFWFVPLLLISVFDLLFLIIGGLWSLVLNLLSFVLYFVFGFYFLGLGLLSLVFCFLFLVLFS